MAVIGRAAATVVALGILLVPAAVTARADLPPELGAGWWEVSAGAADIRVDHCGGETVIGLTRSGDRGEVVDTWTSPLGARWAKVMATRTRVSGWVLWSLPAHRGPSPEP
ncbi:hypothetical protein [Streptomyces sp. LS1784]|uniref:hypothetical protein n=1 Tax=Streptomyces sp. LS1784 TaxID=2851533 RepID=UPI001CCF5FBD|nr:hypothetical protein [Streptomyces sp. LS1784]